MSSKNLCSPVAPSIISAFTWVFTACAVTGPLLLVAFAFAFSGDALERAHVIVTGLEANVFALAWAIALGALYVFAAKSDPLHVAGEREAVAA